MTRTSCVGTVEGGTGQEWRNCRAAPSCLGQTEAHSRPPALWRGGLRPGPWLSALMAGPMCVCLRVLVGHSARAQWPWMENANPHGPELDCHSSCAFLLPLHRFLQNSQSVGGVYTNLCLWFHRVTMETSLKLAFMLVNILLPSKSHGVFM